MSPDMNNRSAQILRALQKKYALEILIDLLDHPYSTVVDLSDRLTTTNYKTVLGRIKELTACGLITTSVAERYNAHQLRNTTLGKSVAMAIVGALEGDDTKN